MFLIEQFANQYRHLVRTLLLVTFICTLSACGKSVILGSDPVPSLVPTPQLASKLLSEGDTAQAAHVYAQLASTESDPVLRQEYQLTATELYFDSELYNDGTRLFATLPGTLNTEPQNTDVQQKRLQILSAYNTLAQGNHTGALQQLPPLRSISERILRVRSLELQSRAYQLLNEPAKTLKSRILLESNLSVPKSIQLNRNKIAELLAAQDINSLRTLAGTPGGSVYRGWIEYAALAKRESSMTPDQFAQRSNVWRSRFPNHPAASINFADAESTDQLSTAIVTDRVALLLPLTGQFSEIGAAIKTGFIAARFAQGAGTSFQLYDTRSDTNTAIQQYELAVSEGASLIIGPLDKSAVINLTAANRISVPTLSLNYVGDDIAGHANLFQFGLLPEDEARDVANYALKQNYRKALVIASDSPVSQRLASAFEQHFAVFGGEVLASDVIAEDSYDYSQQLTKILAINSSHARKRRLETLLDTDIEFEPAIRGDIDTIFIAVNSEQALLLRPQLQFHHAGKVPLLATAHIYSGSVDADKDSELSGVKYNDIPWTLTDAVNNTPLYSTISRNHQDSFQKLIALGIDAYQLHTELEKMRLDPSYSLNGKTGALTLVENNKIRRRLEWAEFQEGLPVKISEALPIETALPPLQGEL